ncbi:MAG: DUF4333 domain-containing protein [Acidimicrobiales bacterium]
MSATRRFLTSATLAATGIGFLVACSTTGSVSQATVESQTSQVLAEQVGRAPDSVSCPGSFEATVGNTMRCVLTDGSTRYGVTLTIDSVDGSNAKWSVKVDDAPMP